MRTRWDATTGRRSRPPEVPRSRTCRRDADTLLPWCPAGGWTDVGGAADRAGCLPCVCGAGTGGNGPRGGRRRVAACWRCGRVGRAGGFRSSAADRSPLRGADLGHSDGGHPVCVARRLRGVLGPRGRVDAPGGSPPHGGDGRRCAVSVGSADSAVSVGSAGGDGSDAGLDERLPCGGCAGVRGAALVWRTGALVSLVVVGPSLPQPEPRVLVHPSVDGMNDARMTVSRVWCPATPLRGPAPAGQYRVLWRVTSADGHPVSGQFTFAANEPGGGNQPGPTAKGPSQGGSPDSALPTKGGSTASQTPWSVWRALALAVVLVVAAFAVVRLRVRRRRTR